MINTYQITYTKYDLVEFTDEEMLEVGYELPITEEDRLEYLENIREHFSNDDMEIKKIRREDYA